MLRSKQIHEVTSQRLALSKVSVCYYALEPTILLRYIKPYI